jgi:type VI secretion system ImpM family protein
MFNALKKDKVADALYSDKTVFFGKLPLHPEFVRVGSHEAQHDVQIAAFEQWFEEGFAQINREMLNDLQTYRRLGLHHCYIISYGTQQKPMLGYIHDCHDKLGRYYPFVIVRQLENPEAHEYYQLSSILYEDFFNQVANLNETYWYNNSDKSFEALLEPIFTASPSFNSHNASNIVFARLMNMSIETFWRQITAGRFEISYQTVIANIVSALYKNTHREQWQLILPLPKFTANFLHITFWLKLISQFIALPETQIQIFWSHENHAYGEQLNIHWGDLNKDLLRKTLERDISSLNPVIVYQTETLNADLVDALTIKADTSLIEAVHLWTQLDWEQLLCLT